MHVMIAVSSVGPEPKKVAAQNRAEQILSGRDYVAAFPGVFVVALRDPAERAQIDEALRTAISSDDNGALLLISPPIPASSGAYVGRLVPTVWPEVNKKIV